MLHDTSRPTLTTLGGRPAAGRSGVTRVRVTGGAVGTVIRLTLGVCLAVQS
jgi:hypothetical protein